MLMPASPALVAEEEQREQMGDDTIIIMIWMSRKAIICRYLVMFVLLVIGGFSLDRIKDKKSKYITNSVRYDTLLVKNDSGKKVF